MYLWKSISVPFYPTNSSNAGEINDLELKNQLDKLRTRDWEWELVEMVVIKSSDDKFFDFVICLKCEVVPFPITKLGFYPKLFGAVSEAFSQSSATTNLEKIAQQKTPPDYSEGVSIM